MASIGPSAAKTQTTKVEQEVVAENQHVFGTRLPSGAKSGGGLSAAVHEGLGLGQQNLPSAQLERGNLALYILLRLPINTATGREVVQHYKTYIVPRLRITRTRIA